MVTKVDKKIESIKTPVKNILISQPQPLSDKSPYFEIERKFNVQLVFQSLIELEAIAGKEFRQQKINITSFTGVIFTSRNAIDHFFRTCDETKISVSQDTKYFCITESVALYLQKFILYRKRKVFFGVDGTNKTLFDVMNKHKENINFLYVCSENQQDNQIVNWLKEHNCTFELGFMYRTKSTEVSKIFEKNKFDIICFFTPTGIKSWFDNFPKFKQGKTIVGTFGDNTKNAAIGFGLKPNIIAPTPRMPSMINALNHFLLENISTN